MRKIIVWYEAGGGLAIDSNANFIVKSAKRIKYFEWTSGTYSESALTAGTSHKVNTLYSGENGIVVRLYSISAGHLRSLNSITIWGDFELDQLSITSEGCAIPYNGRLEIRNENGVLITDNGIPWIDGTYPPDAKNRAGLTGLHAAPAVINPELETALMGDETNKERAEE